MKSLLHQVRASWWAAAASNVTLMGAERHEGRGETLLSEDVLSFLLLIISMSCACSCSPCVATAAGSGCTLVVVQEARKSAAEDSDDAGA
jgi:hypothetical protein